MTNQSVDFYSVNDKIYLIAKELDYNNKRILLVGDGALLFAQNAPGLAVPAPPAVRLPSAAGMAVYSSAGTAGEPVSPAALQPVYLIQSQAQRERQTHN